MRKTNLLWIDCTAALVAGAVMLAARGWLADLYALPENLVVFIGFVNLIFGACSLGLAARSYRRTPTTIATLALANLCWGVGCLIAGVVCIGIASPFGLLALFGEGLFVGTLGVLEWRAQDQLVEPRLIPPV